MSSSSLSLSQLQQKIHRVTRFLSATLSIANAHTVEFYTQDVWTRFVDVTPEEVLSGFSSGGSQQEEPEPRERDHTETTFGFCPETNRLVDVQQLLQAARDHSLPGLGVCWSRDELLQALRAPEGGAAPAGTGAELESDEFMNSKKSHEVQSMSEVVSRLARHCGVHQVIDVGSGKGYLSSFLSLQFGLQVYGIDSSSTNTHGAKERNRKLRKFSKVYQKRSSRARAREDGAKSPEEEKEEEEEEEPTQEVKPGDRGGVPDGAGEEISPREEEDEEEEEQEPNLEDSEDLFLSAVSVDVMETPSPRIPPGRLSREERERRKRENLERKARKRSEAAAAAATAVFSALTSYVTSETELRELISELEDAVMVGLHTCGDLAPSTLRMFAAKPELRGVCSVGCCYHLLSEEFDPAGREPGVCGFPLSQCLRSSSSFCGRNARMSACLALERVSLGQGIQMESLFYRAVLHVILRDHYCSFKSERRVGNVYSKAKSFQDYVRRALRRLELDESKLSDSDIQRYLDTFRPRMDEMTAFNMLKVTLAPCIEGLILLDRLCFLREQDNVSLSALVQLFDPLLSPRCYAVVGLKRHDNGGAAS